MNPDVAADLKDLSATLESIEAVTDLPALRAEIADLSDQAGQPDLWNDPEAAQKVTSRLAHAQGELRRLEELRRRLDDLPVLYELAEDEGDAGSRSPTPTPSGPSCARTSPSLEVRTLLSGEYDPREALVTIRAEAGGVDAADFAEMLMRMYLRWAERHGYGIDVYDTSYAEEAGIKSATFAGARAVRLRHALGRAGHPPAGADLAVRQPGPPADLVRRGRGRAGGRDRATTSRSTRRTCASTSTARRGPAGRA